jgi:hypothetical protein
MFPIETGCPHDQIPFNTGSLYYIRTYHYVYIYIYICVRTTNMLIYYRRFSHHSIALSIKENSSVPIACPVGITLACQTAGFRSGRNILHHHHEQGKQDTSFIAHFVFTGAGLLNFPSVQLCFLSFFLSFFFSGQSVFI